MQLCGRPRRTWNREEEEQDEYALGSASICAVEADLQGEELLSQQTLQDSHSDWKTWKNGKAFSSLGKNQGILN